jgi:hypothetical protein
MNTATTTRPHAVPAALDALRDALPLMRKASTVVYMQGDKDLSDKLRAAFNRCTQALADATKEAA